MSLGAKRLLDFIRLLFSRQEKIKRIYFTMTATEENHGIKYMYIKYTYKCGLHHE